MIRSAAVAAFACVALSTPARASALLLPGDPVPKALAALGGLDGAEGLALSADSGTAVVAFPASDPHRSVLRVARPGAEPGALELPGRVAAVVVAPDGDRAYVLVREIGRKNDVRDVRLLGVDLVALRVSERALLPKDARAIALRNGDDGLLVASRDEIRTFLLPALTSGPLYGVRGDNLAVAPVAGGTRLLVAQPERVVLVDLAASQGRNGLPVEEAVRLAARPEALVSSPVEPEALVLEEGGAVVRLALDPLRALPQGTAEIVAWPGRRSAPSAPLIANARSPEPTPPPEPPPAPEPAPPPEVPRTPVPTPTPAPPPRAAPVPAGEPLPSDAPHRGGAIAGTVEGPAVDSVAAVVAYGPNNVLREAGRAGPDATGRWRIGDLPTGTYRIVAVAGGGRVLLCDPPFATVKVGSGATATAPTLHVMRATR